MAGNFLQSLRNLGGALDAGLDPEAGMDFLTDLREMRQERREARRGSVEDLMAEEQKQLAGIRTLAATEAQQGTSLQELAKLVAGKYGVDINAKQLYNQVPGISSLFLPPTGHEQVPGNAGLSRIAPNLPPEDAAEIIAAIQQGKTAAEIHAHAQTVYGPKSYGRLADEIDDLINGTGGSSSSTVGGPF